MDAKTLRSRTYALPAPGYALLALLLVFAFLATLWLALERDAAPAPLDASRARLAYFQFGVAADTLWLSDGRRREKLLSLPHAPEFGVVPSLAPGGKRFLYTLLPPDTPAPAPESPAQLWLSDAAQATAPRLLLQGVDLRLRPLWSQDGSQAVVRRSTPAGFSLLAVDLVSGQERELVASLSALFPVAMPADGSLLYVELDEAGSRLMRLAQDGPALVALLSPGLTRDWSLSPDGRRLAFLEISAGSGAVASRALVLDLRGASLSVLDVGQANAFAPVWDAAGGLAAGALREGIGGAVLSPSGAFAPPQRGFDVPLAFSADGRLAVRSFDGLSSRAPGNQAVVVIDGGERRTIATGEVTFLGWIDP